MTLADPSDLRARRARTFAYDVEEPQALAMRLADTLGYSPEVRDMVAMPSRRATFETIGVAVDVDAVVRIGDLQQPDLAVMRALHDLPAALRVVHVVDIESPWVWCSAQPAPLEPVRVRRRAFADLSQAVPLLGTEVELVADDTPLPALLYGVAEGARSVILDRDEVPESLHHRHDLGAGPDLSYGLISRVWSEGADYFWLALRPGSETVGTLAHALETIAEHGVNLDFLMSDGLPDGSHRFFIGFGQVGQDAVDTLVADLEHASLDARVLASIPTAALTRRSRP